MTTSEIATLLNEGRCYCPVGASDAELATLALERRWLLSVNPAADVSVEAIVGECSACIEGSTFDKAEIGLLGAIAFANSPAGTALLSFLSRASITNETQRSALEVLVRSAVTNGWWDKCDLIYPFVGGNATAHAQNLKSSSFTITWAGTVTHDVNGITGNGTDGYGDAGYTPSTSGQMALTGCHESMYKRTTGSAAGRTFTGSASLSTFFTMRSFGILDRLNGSVNEAGQSNFITSGAPLGFTMCAKTETGVRRAYAGGVEFTASVADASNPPTVPIFICCLNNAGVAQSFSDANFAGFTFGSGITFAEYQLMAADWQTFQTALSRAV